MVCKICAISFGSRSNKIGCHNTLCSAAFHAECIGLSKPNSVSLSLPIVRVYCRSCDADLISPALDKLQSSLDDGLDTLKSTYNDRLLGLEEGLKGLGRRSTSGNDSFLQPLREMEESLGGVNKRIAQIEKTMADRHLQTNNLLSDIVTRIESLGTFDVDPISLGSKIVVDAGTQTTGKYRKGPPPQPPVSPATPSTSSSPTSEQDFIFITKLSNKTRVDTLKEKLMGITGIAVDAFFVKNVTPKAIRAPKYLQFVVRCPRDCSNAIIDKEHWPADVVVRRSVKRQTDPHQKVMTNAPVNKSAEVEQKQTASKKCKKNIKLNGQNGAARRLDKVKKSGPGHGVAIPEFDPVMMSNLSPLALPFLFNGLNPTMMNPWASLRLLQQTMQERG